MPELNITVMNKRASGTGTIVCGNSDYKVIWNLDGEWDSFDTKTMRVQMPNGTHQDVVFTGNSAALPVQHAAGWISIGLFAGDEPLQTSYTIRARKANVFFGKGLQHETNCQRAGAQRIHHLARAEAKQQQGRVSSGKGGSAVP